MIYRDGVSDSEFNNVVDVEVTAFKSALESCGYLDNAVKISVIVCQKRHHTKMFYESRGTITNPCPGVCLDAFGNDKSITSHQYNEFILNSHSPIQGTCRPCKYTLVYDEIGLKVRIDNRILMIIIPHLLFVMGSSRRWS